MTLQCTAVSPECPVAATLYGYYPNLGVNTFFAAVFGVILVLQVLLGVWKKTWAYMFAVSIGCFGEFLGYIGRIMMHSNPWSQAGLEIQICCLVIAPSFLAAGLYLTLKHVVIQYGRDCSRIKPERYPYIFVICDAGSILIQAIGGGIAASAGQGASQAQLDAGDDLIIAGIAFQIATMMIFGFFSVDFFLRLRDGRRAAHYSHRASPLAGDKIPEQQIDKASTAPKFRFFYWAHTFAYITILIRCIYRIHEMAGGWGNSRMRDETIFLLLDGMMIALAATALTCAHPSLMFVSSKS